MATSTLAIEHVEGSNPAAFKLTRRSDGNSLEPVSIAPPYGFPVSGQPSSHLMHELRWYLEKFLEYPFHPETLHAEHVLDALRDWGRQAFNGLFDRRNAGGWLDNAEIIQITSDDAGVLSWPWEALFDSQAGAYLAHQRRIERRVNKIGDPPPMDLLPKDRVNILLVVARPFEGDVRYRSIARPLVELIRDKGLPAHVDVLRPPTFKQLREHLKAKPNYYHVLHFDGHGSYGGGGGSTVRGSGSHHSPHQFQGQQGCLIFENDKYEPDRKSAADLNALLHDHAVPAVVLNACRSGMLDLDADNAFASVATSLLQSGMRSVVAMAYSLYVSGARVFLPAFYQRLFEAGSVAEAVRAGRQGMLESKDRVCARGQFPLEDWLLPVLYQQAPFEFGFANTRTAEPFESRLPELLEHREPYGFIGRDGQILEMERALHRKASVLLLQGLAGVGKTSLARGFLKWLDATGGLDGAMWFDFREFRTAESVINRTGEMFYGGNFRIAKEKLKMLGDAFSKHRMLIVWDNFESAQANLTSEDRSELRRFLEAIRGGRGKVIITSRSQEEDWLEPELRFELAVRGLDGEERWEYFDTIVHELGVKVRRDDPELKGLMDMLAGHPLAMRAVVPRLVAMPAAKIAEALRTNISALGLSENEEQGRLFGTLRFVEQGLAPELQPLLGLVGLHESHIEARFVELMAKEVNPVWTRPVIDRLMAALANAGLMRDVGEATYEIHPLLTSYLRSHGKAPEPCQRGFVDVMGRIADSVTPKRFDEQRVPFQLHGANFHLALIQAKELSMNARLRALVTALATYAHNTRDFGEARRLYARLLDLYVSEGDLAGEAIALHQLGMVAQEQGDLDKAKEWYFESLTIKVKKGDMEGEAATYHQLGTVAEWKENYEEAKKWYLKSLALIENQGGRDAASIYHHLGIVAQEQRDFAVAKEWYGKSLALKKAPGDEWGAATTHFQLGIVAHRQGDIALAKEWCLKAVQVLEEQGDLYNAQIGYHRLGILAEDQGDLAGAKEWFFKSVAVSEKQGDWAAAAPEYHHLGNLAHMHGDFDIAKEWYFKSLGLQEKRGDQNSVAIEYQGLANTSHEQGDLTDAKKWYLKSLGIREKGRDLHGAAIIYSQMAVIAEQQGGNVDECGGWVTRCIHAFRKAGDESKAQFVTDHFLAFYLRASPADQERLEAIWHEAGLGPFPQEPPPTQ